tara:strand:- start:59 stop:304 length:246 start_codon:yes stop_codon:yes gene_type:complete
MLQTHLNSFFCQLGRLVKNDLRLIERDYKKVMRVIRSCKDEEHLDAANRIITLFHAKHNREILTNKLKKRYWFKKRLILKR